MFLECKDTKKEMETIHFKQKKNARQFLSPLLNLKNGTASNQTAYGFNNKITKNNEKDLFSSNAVTHNDGSQRTGAKYPYVWRSTAN
jgi:hypothetical protein